MPEKKQYSQKDVIDMINKALADLTSAWAEGNVTEEYRDKVGEALSKAHAEAVRFTPGNKRIWE